MASTWLEPIAQQIADFISTISGISTGQVVKGYRWEPKAFDARLPVGAVGIPTVRRVAPGDRESQIGTDDWDLEYPIGLYVEINDLVKAQQLAVELVEKFVRAVDNDPSLGQTATVFEDASVIEATPEVEESQPRALLIYRCRLAVIAHVPTP